jgi:hypothetical protein
LIVAAFRRFDSLDSASKIFFSPKISIFFENYLSLLDTVNVPSFQSGCEEYFTLLFDLFPLMIKYSPFPVIHMGEVLMNMIYVRCDSCVAKTILLKTVFRPTLERFGSQEADARTVHTDISLINFLNCLAVLAKLDPEIKRLIGKKRKFDFISHMFHHMLWDLSVKPGMECKKEMSVYLFF